MPKSWLSAPSGLLPGAAAERILAALGAAYGCAFTLTEPVRMLRDGDLGFFHRATATSADFPSAPAVVELDERTMRLSRDEYPRAVALHLLEQAVRPAIEREYGEARLALDVRFMGQTTYADLKRGLDTCRDALHVLIELHLFGAEDDAGRLARALPALLPCARLTLSALFWDRDSKAGERCLREGFCAPRALGQGLISCLRYDGPPEALVPLPMPEPEAPAEAAPLDQLDYNFLCQLAYQNVPQALLSGAGQLSVRQLCQVLLADQRHHPNEAILPAPIVTALAESDEPEFRRVQQLTFLGGVNHNDTTGLCAIALSDGEGSIACFRGSESQDVPSQVDWLDNFGAGITGVSVQYPDVERFMAAFGSERGRVCGHSKGGHNALYAAAVDARVVGGAAYNGQGFAKNALDGAQISQLQASGVHNLVADTDLVGALLYHYGTQRFVKLLPGTPRTVAESHRLENIAYLDGNTIPGTQSLATMAVGQASRLVSEWVTHPLTAAQASEASGRIAPLALTAALSLAGTTMEAVAQHMGNG